MRPDADNKTIAPQHQKEIRDDVQKLFELISEFKDQVDKSDLNSTISVSVVKKAQQIEKLAKHVKDLAKG
jgi:c-di-AMP phosphodiesterase-like protein